MRLHRYVSAVVIVLAALASACAEKDRHGVRRPASDGGAPQSEAGSAAGGEALGGGTAADESGGGASSSAPAAGAGTNDGAWVGGAGGQGGASGFILPDGCPGVLDDYTMIVIGTDGADTFNEEQLDGQCLVVGGLGEDVFAPSPPGAGDCLLGGDGNDRFETTFLSAPATFVGGPGDDTFVLRGSLDTDVAYISDFRREGDDRILLNAMVYGLMPGSDPEDDSLLLLALVPDFEGGNSTAGPGVRILYNPEDGGVWYDSDEDGEFAEAVRIAVIENFAEYEFSLGDWELE
jgi:hypothetical protein